MGKREKEFWRKEKNKEKVKKRRKKKSEGKPLVRSYQGKRLTFLTLLGQWLTFKDEKLFMLTKRITVLVLSLQITGSRVSSGYFLMRKGRRKKKGKDLEELSTSRESNFGFLKVGFFRLFNVAVVHNVSLLVLSGFLPSHFSFYSK